MLGSNVFRELLQSGFDVSGTTRDGSSIDGKPTLQFDVTQDPRSFLDTYLSNVDYVINCIGLIPHKFSRDKNLDLARAIELNSIFPNVLADAASRANCRVIQIATDCVFRGDRGSYSEDSRPDPGDVYGITKAAGEVFDRSTMNLRCSVVGEEKGTHFSLLSWFLSQPLNSSVFGYTNHLWNGISAIAFSKIVTGIVRNDKFNSGTFHVIPADTVTKFQLLELFAKFGNRTDIKIIPSKGEIEMNRKLSTIHEDFNLKLWEQAGYPSLPSIEQMMSEVFNNKSKKER